MVSVQQVNQTNILLGDIKVRFNQTNSNAGDVNNAVAEKGNAIQTTGTGNKVQVHEPKGSRWGAFWEMVKADSGTGAFELHGAADGHDFGLSFSALPASLIGRFRILTTRPYLPPANDSGSLVSR